MNPNRILAGAVLDSIRHTTPGNHVPHRYDHRPLFAGIFVAVVVGLFVLVAASAHGV